MTDALDDSTPVSAVDNASCELGGEAVVLDTRSGTYYGMNAVGTVLWRLLQKPCSIAELRDLVAKEFDVTPAECEADVLDFVSSLIEKGLVRTHERSPSQVH